MLQPPSRFLRLLERRRPLLLDGGLATQLEAQGADIGNALWSASLIDDKPDQIVDAHVAYLKAGAECIATATYQASREGFAEQGFSADESDALMLRSVLLARRARDEVGSDAAIAASIGPFGAMLHDGSEYRGDYGVSDAVLAEFHAPRLQLFDSSGVDVIALETIPSRQEAEVLAGLLASCDTPSWVSFSCVDGEHICDGTPIRDVAPLFTGHSNVVAIGINCTPPHHAADLVTIVKEVAPDKHAIAYPNSGETYNARDNSWSGTVTPVDCATASSSWVDAGAKIVGGCCRMGPTHIQAIGKALAETARS